MFRTKKILTQPFWAFAVTVTLVCSTAQSGFSQFAESQPLAVGDKAPALDVAQWITDGKGKFPQVTGFEAGKVYVVEFWATWCGPCADMMPVIARWQQRYDGQVQFLGITDEDAETVREFKEREFPGEVGTSFGVFMNQYSVGADPDGSTHMDFLGNVSRGIPVAFLIGKTGEVEAIDHPAALQPLIEKIVDGTWNRDEHYAQQKAMKLAEKEINDALRREDYAAALTASEKIVPFYSEQEQTGVRFQRAQFALRLDSERGHAFFKETLELFAEQEGAVAAMVWKAVELKSNDVPVSAENLKVAEEALRKQIKQMPTATQDDVMMKGATIDILSHLLFETGRLDEAIASQERAAELLDEDEITDFLEFLKAEKADLELEADADSAEQ